MDKASAYGAGDCRFESCRGHLVRRCEPPTGFFHVLQVDGVVGVLLVTTAKR